PSRRWRHPGFQAPVLEFAGLPVHYQRPLENQQITGSTPIDREIAARIVGLWSRLVACVVDGVGLARLSPWSEGGEREIGIAAVLAQSQYFRLATAQCRVRRSVIEGPVARDIRKALERMRLCGKHRSVAIEPFQAGAQLGGEGLMAIEAMV